MPKFAKGSQEAKDYMASIRKKKGSSKACGCCGKCKCVSGGMLPFERTHFKPIKMSEYRADAESPDSMEKTKFGDFYSTSRKVESAPQMMRVTMPRQDLDTSDKVLDGVRSALRARIAQQTPLAKATKGNVAANSQSARLASREISNFGMTTPTEQFAMFPNPPSRLPLAQEPAELSGGGMCGGIADCAACRGMGVVRTKNYR